MPYATRNGVRLFYNDTGAGDPPLLFIHGWCCDSTHWRRTTPAFRRSHRIVTTDLRGHGKSDKPKQDYTMDGFCEDIEWLMGQLGLRKPIAIGHSMGGNIALRLAGRRKRPLSGMVMIDSPAFPKFTREGLQQLNGMFRALEDTSFREAARVIIDNNLFIPSSPPELRRRITNSMLRAPQHVLAPAFRNLWAENRTLGKRVNVPSLFIDAMHPMEELERVQRGVPGIQIGRTVGAGHFNMLEAPDQVNGMLRIFIDQLPPGGT
jgi:pimeloyl-ACP methyl ester carboxylesterase